MKKKRSFRLFSMILALAMMCGIMAEGFSAPPAAAAANNEGSFTLPVKLFGTDGTDLTSAKTITIPIENGQTVEVPGGYESDIKTLTDGSNTYDYSYAAEGFNGDEVTQLHAGQVSQNTQDERQGESWWEGSIWDGTRTLKQKVERTVTTVYGVWAGDNQPNNANGTIAYKTKTETYTVTQTFYLRNGWVDDEGTATEPKVAYSDQINNEDNTLHFMYEKQGVAIPEQELTREKYVTDNGDDTYDLTLTVSGAAGSITNKQKLDVLFIVDKSGSMERAMSDRDRTSRIRAVRTAIGNITNGLSGSETLDVRYSMVTFSGNWGGYYDDADVLQTWTTSADDITGAASWIDPDGGTNYQAGLRTGNELLKDARPDAMTAVIFLSDGLPTFRYDEYGDTEGNGQNDEGRYNLAAGKNEAAKLAVDFFYTVGVGNEDNMKTYMEDLAAAATQAGTTNFYLGTDSESLNEIFDNIEGSITSILCENVTVTDTLSENVEIVTSGGDVPQPSDLTITVTNRNNGEQVARGQGSVEVDGVTITASYNDKTRQIVLDFPDIYKLNKDYTYMVTATIRATEKAYENYRDNGNAYPNTGDEGTGSSSAGKLGVYTNNKATVEYTYNGQNYESDYPMPVIQLKPGTLQITKEITGELTADEKTALVGQMTFDVTLNGETTTYPLSAFTPAGNDTYTFAIPGLSPNTQYKVTEDNAEMPNYTLSTDGSSSGAGIISGTTNIVTFVNHYTRQRGDLVLTKTVNGLDAEGLRELKDELTFTVSGPDGYNQEIRFDDVGWTTEDSKTFTYTLSALDTGPYTVTEAGYDNITGYLFDAQNSNPTAEATVGNGTSATAALTNTYTPAEGYLTIEKVILEGESYGDGRDTFTFKVTATSGKEAGKVWYFTINGAGTAVDKFKLPVGTYQVDELSNINYTCVDSSYTVEITGEDTQELPKTVTFTNMKKPTDIPTDGSGVENVPVINEDGTITWTQKQTQDTAQ